VLLNVFLQINILYRCLTVYNALSFLTDWLSVRAGLSSVEWTGGPTTRQTCELSL